jgi:3-methyladenine DNA glycosylase Tag
MGVSAYDDTTLFEFFLETFQAGLIIIFEQRENFKAALTTLIINCAIF